MPSAQELLDRYADGTPYAESAREFLDLERWTGDDPILLLAEAAAVTTGRRFSTGVKPTVERFRDAFVDTGRATTYADLAAVELEDEELIAAVGAQRKRRVLLEAAAVLADRREDDDLSALRAWATAADPYRYRADPIGGISGVGPSSFQYLRMLAGIDTARPDPKVTQLVADVDAELADSPLDASEPLRTIASCEWLALESSYRRIEVDRIAWWTYADDRERENVVGGSA